MCGYNEVNGSNACADDYTLNKVLKEELGFKGAVISDWVRIVLVGCVEV